MEQFDSHFFDPNLSNQDGHDLFFLRSVSKVCKTPHLTLSQAEVKQFISLKSGMMLNLTSISHLFSSSKFATRKWRPILAAFHATCTFCKCRNKSINPLASGVFVSHNMFWAGLRRTDGMCVYNYIPGLVSAAAVCEVATVPHQNQLAATPLKSRWTRNKDPLRDLCHLGGVRRRRMMERILGGHFGRCPSWPSFADRNEDRWECESRYSWVTRFCGTGSYLFPGSPGNCGSPFFAILCVVRPASVNRQITVRLAWPGKRTSLVIFLLHSGTHKICMGAWNMHVPRFTSSVYFWG